MQLGVPQHNTGEMMDTLTPLPSQQCMFYYLVNLKLTSSTRPGMVNVPRTSLHGAAT